MLLWGIRVPEIASRDSYKIGDYHRNKSGVAAWKSRYLVICINKNNELIT